MFFLGKLHVHVGLGGGEGDGRGVHHVVGSEGVGGDDLLVVDDKGDGDLVLDTSFTSFA